MLAKSYGKECDLWSVGVILFTLMCGYPPFWGDTEQEIYQRIKKGRFGFESAEWNARSESVKILIMRLLDRNPATRCVLTRGRA